MTYRSKKYLDFVKTLDCAVSLWSNCQGEVAPHHTESGGTGMKGSDLSCIPLCHNHHINHLHKHGKKSFEINFRLDFRSEVIRTNQAYIKKLENLLYNDE